MPDLDLNPVTRHQREYSVAEILRLGEKFRHLAQDLSEVFIVASRQAIVRRVETDPEEEEAREGLRFFSGLKKRFLDRRRRMSYSKPQLVTAKAARAEAPQSVTHATAVAKDAAPSQPVQRQSFKVKIDATEKKPMPASARSLAEAAAGFRATLDRKFQPKHEQAPAVLQTSKSNALQLSPEELPKYKKYRDIGEQFLTAKQYPHFRTLLDKAKSELSENAMNLLHDLAKEHGFDA